MALERILVIGSDENTHELLRPHTEQLFAADHHDDLWDLIHSVSPQAIVVSEGASQQNLGDLVSELCERTEDIPTIVVTSSKKLRNADQYKAMGVIACLDGTNAGEKIAHVIDTIRFSGQEKEHREFFSDHCPSCVSIVGKSEATARTLKMIRVVASSSCNPVLIVGETGTGKELAARAVHILRHGSDKKFVAVNCAALTSNLLESELFGHVKGSFTSAEKEKTGLLELAGNGSIFLDEVSEMPLDLQAKLLRVVQEKTFRKVGGTADIHCEATIITSSNRNLMQAVEEGKFRRDLYYRLAICPIHLAPLRHDDRIEDVPLLADYFVKTSGICPDKEGKIKGFTRLAIQALSEHSWPGNVRELKNVVDRAIMLENTDKIGLDNLIFEPEQYAGTTHEKPSANRTIKDFSLEKAEKELIAKALAEAGWQKTKAASMLGITRATLYAKVKQYNIQQPEKERALASA